MENKPGYLTIQDVADYFGVPHHSVRSWIRRGLITNSTKIGKRVLICVTEIERLIELGKRKPASPAVPDASRNDEERG